MKGSEMRIICQTGTVKKGEYLFPKKNILSGKENLQIEVDFWEGTVLIQRISISDVVFLP